MWSKYSELRKWPLFTLAYFAAAQHTFLLSSKCSVSSVPNTLVASTDVDQDFVQESVPRRLSCINLTVKPCTKPQRKITPQQNSPKSFMKCLISKLDFFFHVPVPCPDLADLCLLPTPASHTSRPFLFLPLPSHPSPWQAQLYSESLSNFSNPSPPWRLGVGGSCLWEQKLICYN